MHDKASVVHPVLAPEILRPEGKGALLILCDHARDHIPARYDNLGIAPAHLQSHIALDIGAAGVSRRLSERLDAPAILAPVSRLVLDLNRDPETQSPFPEWSDGVAIPGNQGLAAEERQARIKAFFHPYHRAAERQLAAMLARGMRPIVIGLHSFTPVMDGKARPWPVGFLYHHDPRLYRLMAEPLRARGLMVGDNEPYSGAELYYSMHRHGEAHGLLQATIEIRQDLINDPAGEAAWADILADCLTPILQKGL